MSQSKKTYVLSKVKQLIDLNGDSKNFDLSFKVTCHDDTPFHVLVVDQTTLDNSEKLNYKEIKNSISGNIVADKNVYQNYFLILKSDKECKVDVEWTKKELPITPEKIEPSHIINSNKQSFGRKMRVPNSSSSVNWKKIGLLTLIIIVGLALLWYFYKNSKKTSNKNVVENMAIDKGVFGFEPVKSPVASENNFAGSPDPRTYRPSMKFKSQINNHSNAKESRYISNRSPDMVSDASSSYKGGGDLKISGSGKGLSLLDRLRNAKI